METNEINLVQAPPLNKLLDFINMDYHEYYNSALPLIEALLNSTVKLDRGNTKKIDSIYNRFSEFRDLLEQHIGKEKHIVFPIIQELSENRNATIEIAEFKKVYSKIVEENSKLISILEELKKLTNNFNAPENASQTLKQSYFDMNLLEQNFARYVEMEKDILLPKLQAIDDEVNHVLSVEY